MWGLFSLRGIPSSHVGLEEKLGVPGLRETKNKAMKAKPVVPCEKMKGRWHCSWSGEKRRNLEERERDGTVKAVEKGKKPQFRDG